MNYDEKEILKPTSMKLNNSSPSQNQTDNKNSTKINQSQSQLADNEPSIKDILLNLVTKVDKFGNQMEEMKNQTKQLREEMKNQTNQLREEMKNQTNQLREELREEMKNQTKQIREELREELGEKLSEMENKLINLFQGNIAKNTSQNATSLLSSKNFFNMPLYGSGTLVNIYSHLYLATVSHNVIYNHEYFSEVCNNTITLLDGTIIKPINDSIYVFQKEFFYNQNISLMLDYALIPIKDDPSLFPLAAKISNDTIDIGMSLKSINYVLNLKVYNEGKIYEKEQKYLNFFYSDLGGTKGYSGTGYFDDNGLLRAIHYGSGQFIKERSDNNNSEIEFNNLQKNSISDIIEKCKWFESPIYKNRNLFSEQEIKECQKAFMNSIKLYARNPRTAILDASLFNDLLLNRSNITILRHQGEFFQTYEQKKRLQNVTNEFFNKRNNFKNEYSNFTKEYSIFTKEYKNLTNQYKNLTNQYKNLTKQYEKLKNEYQSINKPINEINQTLNNISQINNKINQTLNNISQRNNKINQGLNNLSQKNNDFNQTLNNITQLASIIWEFKERFIISNQLRNNYSRIKEVLNEIKNEKDLIEKIERKAKFVKGQRSDVKLNIDKVNNLINEVNKLINEVNKKIEEIKKQTKKGRNKFCDFITSLL